MEYDRDSRQGGEPKYTFRRLIKLALDGVLSFSYIPLKISGRLGVIIAIGSILYAIKLLEKLDLPTRTLVECDLTKPLPPRTRQLDALLSLDVLEHIDNDKAAAAHLSELLTQHGIAIVSVPALPKLYSEFDAVQGHRRRYTPETLRAAFEGTGLEIVRPMWWGSWMVPFMARRTKTGSNGSTEIAVETYRKYLATPIWPASLILPVAFKFDESRTLASKSKTGTSIIAAARKKLHKR